MLGFPKLFGLPWLSWWKSLLATCYYSLLGQLDYDWIRHMVKMVIGQFEWHWHSLDGCIIKPRARFSSSEEWRGPLWCNVVYEDWDGIM